MNKLRPVALLCAGPVSRSPLTRLPILRRNLAWVKSSSFRVASRAVNALGAGAPALEISEMKRAGIWVISVPNSELASSLAELRSAGLEWRNRVLLIFDSEAESDSAAWFQCQGAAVATFAPVDSEESRYIVEGDSEAVRLLRRLVEDPRSRRVIEIKKGSKAKYLAGALAATQCVLPHIAEAVECFQTAGIGNLEAKAITESLLAGAIRSYFRAGRRAIKTS
jgi:predicted short-subunit dehydrogenase-like oxidoreductase (DUF2520 family)